MRLIDVSPSLSADAIVWPGDTQFSLTPKWDIGAGSAVNVSTVTTTTHAGAHIDAPSHVRAGAPDITETPLESCIGECLVVDVSDLVGKSTTPHAPAPPSMVIERIAETVGETLDALPPRLILRHRTTPLTDWDSNTPGVDPRLVTWFGAQGGVLIGIDLLSFDPEVCREVPAHHACIDAGIVMLEGLDLTGAEPGLAELIALPIPWQGADAAPARAVLRYSSEPPATAPVTHPDSHAQGVSITTEKERP